MLPSSPLVLQSRLHYLRRKPESSRRPDALKDVDTLAHIDFDAWIALNIQGIVLDIEHLNALSPMVYQDWLKLVQSIGITIFGLDRVNRRTLRFPTSPGEATDPLLGFPIVQLKDRLLLTTLQETVVCLSPQPDRVVFLGRTWSDRVVSWMVGCRFMAVGSGRNLDFSTELAYQRGRLSDPQA